jgi:phenylalanyl-tRNA synthetase beta chain
MRLPVEWIKEYAPVEAEAEEIAHRLTMVGLEVEEIEDTEQGAVLNITVTPNRGDCLSVIGTARELAAIYGMALPSIPHYGAESTLGDAARFASVTIEAPELCPRYAARIVRHLQIGPSPQWMQSRLIAAGMRPINNVVDVTNYVMLEMGQPLHAFDYNTLQGHQIIVRRARPGEKIITLDGTEHTLTPEMLMICDAERPVAVAGVMGGFETEMSLRTQTMLLESAHFHPLAVRRTARALRLHTEASYRFERVVDPGLVVAAANRACDLMAELGIGEVVPGVIDVYPAPEPERTLGVRPARASAMLGFEVSGEQVRESLSRLGFRPAPPHHDTGVAPKDHHMFRVPTWRPDIVREIDLIEEIGRILGYEHIPERLPVGTTTQGRDSAWGRFVHRVRDILVGAGLQEIVSHGLLAPSPFEHPQDAQRRVAIRNALSAELSGLRCSLLPGLLDTVERNARRGQGPLAFFEVGRIFRRGEEGYEEKTSLAAALAGPIVPPFWERTSRGGPADFFTAKGLVERLFAGLGVEEPTFIHSDDPRLHPGRAASVLLQGQPMGLVGELHPNLTREMHVRERILVFELSFEALQQAAEARRLFQPLAPFPAVTRDLAPRVAMDVAYERVRAAVNEAGVDILERLELTDVYTGAPLPEGMKSYTLSLTFRAPDRTLTDAEVNAALQQLRAALETACGATFVA